MEKLTQRQHDELIEAVKTIVCYSKRKALTEAEKAQVEWMIRELGSV